MTTVQTDKIQKLVKIMPQLRSYSIILALYVITKDVDGYGVPLKQWFIMEKTGLCQRSLQLAIAELESKGILEREGKYAPPFKITL
jgi:hypothetical protein